MGKPQIDIQVDDVTGRWSVDALPMILVPRHFFLNNHYAVEAALGAEKLEDILRPAGHRSAYFWCEKEAAHHGMVGIEVFHHYMRRITQRGWGQFEILDVAPETGTAHVRLRNSAMVDDAQRNSGCKVCYMFASWLEGSLEYVAVSAGRGRSRQRQPETKNALDSRPNGHRVSRGRFRVVGCGAFRLDFE